MNRTLLAAIIAMIAWTNQVALRAAIIAPGIGGIVYHDLDLNNAPSAGEGLAGVSVNLYQDDGDGIFEPGAGDSQVGVSILTDAGGEYAFNGLTLNAPYFVQRPAQVVGSSNLPHQVSSVLFPNTPKLIIDGFENNQVVKANPPTPIATSTLSDPASTALGLERDLYVKLVSGIGQTEFRSNAFGVDVLQFDNSSAVVGQGIVTWDGKDLSASPTPSLGLGDIDLTVGGTATGFVMQIGVDAPGAGENVKIRLFDDSASEYSEVSVPLPVTGGAATAWVYTPFSALVGSVTADDVNAIQLLFGEGARSVDAQIDIFGTMGPVTHNFQDVPEPSTCVLVIGGLCGLLARRRRR